MAGARHSHAVVALRGLAVLLVMCACWPASAGAADYRSTVMGTSGLVSYWRLGETTGTSAADEKGLQAGTYNGTLERGQPGALTGDSNPSVNFDAATDYVNIPHRTQYNFNAFTIEMWGSAQLVRGRDYLPHPRGQGDRVQ